MRVIKRGQRALIFVATALSGSIAGCWVRRSVNPQQSTAEQQAFHRGQGEELIEYFDPACASSRSLHVLLDQEFQHGTFEHVMVPVAINRSTDSALADGLCAQSGDHAWLLASEWAREPPSDEVLRAIDPAALRVCAKRVEAATRHIGSLQGAQARIMTPAVEFRGTVYMGLESKDALLNAIKGERTP